jgi:sulfite reductase alpha subunit-like flavoprotein
MSSSHPAGTGLTYEHGDHVAVYVQNSPDTVAAAVKALGWDPAASFSLSIPPGNPEMLPPPFSGPITVTEALRQHVEVLQHPDKSALLALASCAASAQEAQRLRWLAGHDGKAEFAQYMGHDKRSLIEVLEVRNMWSDLFCTSIMHILSRSILRAGRGWRRLLRLWLLLVLQLLLA